MSAIMERDTAESLLAEAKRDLSEAHARAIRLETVIQYIEAKLAGAQSSESVKIELPEREDRSRPFARMSGPEAAMVVLRTNGKPMKIGDLVRSILRGGYYGEEKKLKASLYTTLLRSKDRFYRIRPARFGLVEWKKGPQEAAEKEKTPPGG